MTTYTGNLLPNSVIHQRCEKLLSDAVKARLRQGTSIIAGGFAAAVCWETTANATWIKFATPTIGHIATETTLTMLPLTYGGIDEWIPAADEQHSLTHDVNEHLRAIAPVRIGGEIENARQHIVFDFAVPLSPMLGWHPGDNTQLIIHNLPSSLDVLIHFDHPCTRIAITYCPHTLRFIAYTHEVISSPHCVLPVSLALHASRRLAKYLARGFPVKHLTKTDAVVTRLRSIAEYGYEYFVYELGREKRLLNEQRSRNH